MHERQFKADWHPQTAQRLRLLACKLRLHAFLKKGECHLCGTAFWVNIGSVRA